MAPYILLNKFSWWAIVLKYSSKTRRYEPPPFWMTNEVVVQLDDKSNKYFLVEYYDSTIIDKVSLYNSMTDKIILVFE